MKFILIGLMVVLILCALLSMCVAAGIGAYTLFAVEGQSTTQAMPLWSTPALLPTFTRPALPSPVAPATEVATPFVEAQGPTPEVQETLSDPLPTVLISDTWQILENTIVPINDPLDLAERLQGKKNLPANLDTIARVYEVGDKETFWVTNSDNNKNTEENATLRYKSDHVYFWIQDGVSYSERALSELVETFDDKIYPTNREFFGEEWSPGVDADPRLYILYTRGMGSSVAGYFSTADEYLPTVREYSNGHEMFFLSADHVDLAEEFAYGVLAHEFQHMIHWYRDRNEETWINEGFSDLAMLLNDYSIGGFDRLYIANPDIQLNDWPTTPGERGAHYGASFLFVAYFLDRFGEEATKAIVADAANGLPSIDKALEEMGATDNGQPIEANDVFADWVIASYLKDPNVADGRYTYHNYPRAPQASDTETISRCPMDAGVREVSQYGVDYLRVECQGNYTLRFEGAQEVNALPADPYSGDYAFYSNRGDESDMTLTRTFDFTNHSGPLTLSYWTWYDLEEDYDYLFLEASEDGENWQILTTPSGTADDPSGNSYGWGYNGLSGGGPEWIQERVDISQFAGKKVQIRFEYITDGVVNGEGFLLDDVSVPESGYFSDFEQDDGGWEAAGFVRIQNVLPQTFILSIIQLGENPSVVKVGLPANNFIEIPLEINQANDAVILVISGSTPFTRQKARYQLNVAR